MRCDLGLSYPLNLMQLTGLVGWKNPNTREHGDHRQHGQHNSTASTGKWLKSLIFIEVGEIIYFYSHLS